MMLSDKNKWTMTRTNKKKKENLTNICWFSSNSNKMIDVCVIKCFQFGKWLHHKLNDDLKRRTAHMFIQFSLNYSGDDLTIISHIRMEHLNCILFTHRGYLIVILLLLKFNWLTWIWFAVIDMIIIISKKRAFILPFNESHQSFDITIWISNFCCLRFFCKILINNLSFCVYFPPESNS